MEKKQGKSKMGAGRSLLLSIIAVFCILGAVVFSVAKKTSSEMSASAIQNLSESLDLIKCTIEAILNNEAEFQTLIAKEIANAEDPESYICSYEKNQAMVKMSLILAGKTEGVSNTGDPFSEADVDFSLGKSVDGLPISRSYVNYMGAWAYTMKCPVEKDGQEIGSLYVEYVYDALDRSLPDGFYEDNAVLYIMDAKSERFVLKPKGMGMRSAGHLNLEDYYRANSIEDEGLRAEVTSCLESGKNILFYHDIRQENALNYMWAVNDGTIFLVGYVPLKAILKEGRTVSQNIMIVVTVMMAAFFLCCILYYLNRRQEEKIWREREKEREIHNQRLAEALQAAQLASNSKTTFLSNMSHDIRTPMNAVLGFTTLLALDADDPAKVREYTKKIMASGQHLLSLINDILDVSKIESGKMVLASERFTLKDLVSSVEAIIRPMTREKEQSFHVEVTGIKHEYLLGDETRIDQILINLLSNAVKYTPQGGDIWFRLIGLKQRSSQYEHIRIEVEDNGYGMTQEYMKTIFDAFTRAENSTTNKVQGTGLGMAITKNLVDLMGGIIEVSSEIDKGSLFRVELDLRIPESQSDKQFWEQCRIWRILVADADEGACQNIKQLMKDTGVQIDTALSVKEAMEQIQDSTHGEEGEGFQAVLIDWDLLDMDPIRTAVKLRGCTPTTVPILFMASYETQGIEGALQIENAKLLEKPFFVSAFKEKLLEIQVEQSEGMSAKEEDGLEGLHFLAAEDNAINAEILSELLEMEGATCEIVENGKLAVERFASAAADEFDAVLMDVQMPVMNGYEATKAIRAMEHNDAMRIPIIAMTANAFAEDEREALEAGMDVHVAKPIDIELLKKAIKQCIENRGLRNGES